ncbi:MAG: hypothetical protein ACK5MU_04250 [Candidatus Saccharimonadales bacterium]
MKSTQQENAPEAIHQLAVDIDRFAEEYDTYGYRDDVDDTEENIKEIECTIINGEIAYMKRYLQEIIDEDNPPEHIQTAKRLLCRLEFAVKSTEISK